jgi:hypothetical protein
MYVIKCLNEIHGGRERLLLPVEMFSAVYGTDLNISKDNIKGGRKIIKAEMSLSLDTGRQSSFYFRKVVHSQWTDMSDWPAIVPFSLSS